MAGQADRYPSDKVLQAQSGKFLGYLVRVCGDFNDAEDVHQDVMLTALGHWRRDGVPDNPLAWLLTTARNRATDHFRRQGREDRILARLEAPEPVSDGTLGELLEDDFLRLIFTCCHPALDRDVRVALTLKSVVGLTLDEVARAFVVPPRTMEQRLVRAKRKIKRAGIAYEIPAHDQLDVRLDSVLQTLYLMFTEGYAATAGRQLVRAELCQEAIRLSGVVQGIYPNHAELLGLKALMILQDSRRGARTDRDGHLVPLDLQDRSLWDADAIRLGTAILEHALGLHQRPGPYQVQAAIAALHTEAADAGSTDWQEIGLLYETLLRIDYSPVAHLNYAVALAMNDRPEAAGHELQKVNAPLHDYFPYWCARGHVAAQRGELTRAKEDYGRALALAGNDAERGHVAREISRLGSRDRRSSGS